jgi:hypothetical protein
MIPLMLKIFLIWLLFEAESISISASIERILDTKLLEKCSPGNLLEWWWTSHHRKSITKREKEGLLISVWESEWSSTKKGETTRNFFPNVKAARTLKTKIPSNKIAQILTGHCLLNAH